MTAIARVGALPSIAALALILLAPVPLFPQAAADAVAARAAEGAAAFESGQFAKAAEIYAKLVADRPGDAGLHMNLGMARYMAGTPNVHYLRGLSLLRDDADEAVAEFTRELQVSPDHAPAMVQIAQEYLKRGDLERVRDWAARAVAKAPRSFLAQRVLGQARLQGGDVPGAIRALERAVALEPSSPSARFTLARAYQRAGRKADAERERRAFTRLEREQRTERGGANAVGDPEDEASPQ